MICPKCARKFTLPIAFHWHIQTHGKCAEIPYQCDIGGCGKVYITMKRLLAHKKKHVSCILSKGQYECGNCHKPFRNEKELNQHKNTYMRI